MLPNHAPLVIAEQFAILHALHPGRIDLGVGRARGADPVTVLALGRASNSSEPDTFADQLDELNGFLDGGLPNGHPYAAVKVSPTAEPPPIFLLSSSAASAELAAVRGLPLAFAHHLAPEATATALAAYRTAFRPGPALKEPYAIVTVGVVCAESQDDAERAAIAASAIRARRVLASRQGRTPTTDELVSPQLTEQEALLIADILAAGRILVGTPDTVHAAMVELSRRTTADEVMVCTIEYDGPARIRTLTAAARNAN
jgi:luciferase family oxidoreductase group 1